MAENTGIPYATHTFSPWIGCCPVHAGCDHCYAAAMAGRMGVTWGKLGTRRRTAESTWRQVERWNREAVCNCEADHGDDHWHTCSQRDRPRVMPSLCDVFEEWPYYLIETRTMLSDVRREFFALIDKTPNLDWLLFTKRPWNIISMWPEFTTAGENKVADDIYRGIKVRRENVWLAYSASDQDTLDAGAEHLRHCADLCPVLGLSLEPLLGRVLIPGWVDWVIVGGESGPHARPCNVGWIRSIVEQCRDSGVSCWVKQDSGRYAGQQGRIPDFLWKVKELPR